MAKYSELRDSLKTGDIVLFSGKGRISKLIQYFTNSEYSHVGLVIRDPALGVLLLESTTLSNLKDIDSGKPCQGVQLVTLSDRLATYNGEVAIRRLQATLTPSEHQTIAEMRREFSGLPYEENKLTLVFAALDCWDIWPDDENHLESLFCSELVAEAFKRVKLLPAKLRTDEFTPADFAKGFQSILGPVVEVES